MKKGKDRGIKRLVNATRYSMSGIKAAWNNEEAFRQEIIGSVVLIPSAFWLGDTHAERLLLVGSCLIVLIVELMNSAIEAVVDRIGPELHELSGRAKDIGSAAVFISLVNLALVWAAICFL